jgi:hypothetical protein
MPEIPGSTIVAYCKKCEADTSHTVLEVLEGGKRIGKVRCDACREEHPFRRPKAPQPKKAAKEKTAKPRRHSSKSKAPQEVAAHEAWRQVESMVQAAAKTPYEMGKSYDKGEVIEHPQFGVGVVVTVLSPTKVEVLFPTVRRKLVCGKPD